MSKWLERQAELEQHEATAVAIQQLRTDTLGNIALESAEEAPEGIVPTAKTIRETRYEVLPEPLQMHCVKDTKKWVFGNAKTWDDFTTTGFYPKNTNITIVAVAYVPIAEKDGTQTEAAYYLDALSFGDYLQTGRVRFTTGYNWSDLDNGHVERTNPGRTIEATILEPEELEAKKIEFRQMIADEAAMHPEKYPTFFKSTYQMVDPPIPCTAVLPKELDFIWVEDYENKRPPRKLHQSQEITIAGTFEHGSQLYGRPLKAAENNYWFGVPMDCLMSQEELYNTEVDRPTRAAMGTLTWSERYFWEPIAKTIYSPLTQRLLNKNKKKG